MAGSDDALNVSQGNNIKKLSLVGHNIQNNREKDDFYPTPPEATIKFITITDIL